MSIVKIIEDRMRRAFAGEDVPELRGKKIISYGDVTKPPSPEEIQRRIDVVNRLRQEESDGKTV